LSAGLLTKKLLAPCVFSSSINSECFNYGLEYHLLPELSPGHTIIIDNASFHKSARTQEIIENAKCQLRFLPPYSPDLNPIENGWAIIKARIKKVIRQVDDLNQAIDHVLTVY
jgi:isftu1 transposase